MKSVVRPGDRVLSIAAGVYTDETLQIWLEDSAQLWNVSHLAMTKKQMIHRGLWMVQAV